MASHPHLKHLCPIHVRLSLLYPTISPVPLHLSWRHYLLPSCHFIPSTALYLHPWPRYLPSLFWAEIGNFIQNYIFSFVTTILLLAVKWRTFFFLHYSQTSMAANLGYGPYFLTMFWTQLTYCINGRAPWRKMPFPKRQPACRVPIEPQPRLSRTLIQLPSDRTTSLHIMCLDPTGERKI